MIPDSIPRGFGWFYSFRHVAVSKMGAKNVTATVTTALCRFSCVGLLWFRILLGWVFVLVWIFLCILFGSRPFSSCVCHFIVIVINGKRHVVFLFEWYLTFLQCSWGAGGCDVERSFGHNGVYATKTPCAFRPQTMFHLWHLRVECRYHCSARRLHRIQGLRCHREWYQSSLKLVLSQW